MKLLFENWRKYLTENVGRTPLGAHFKLSPNVKEGAEVFWYETADGVMLPKDDPRLHDDAVKEVSGVITSISAPPDPTGPVTSTPEGPYVLVTHAGGTVEINPEWFDSVYLMGAGLASDPDQPRPDEERYLRNAPRGGELGAYLSELGRDYEQEKTEIASDPLKGPVLDAILRILGPAPDEKMILYASTTLSLLLGDSQLPLHGPGAFFARPLNPADKAAVEAYNDALGQAAAPRHRAATSRRRGPPRGEFV